LLSSTFITVMTSRGWLASAVVRLTKSAPCSAEKMKRASLSAGLADAERVRDVLIAEGAIAAGLDQRLGEVEDLLGGFRSSFWSPSSSISCHEGSRR
jgi:hypothetical protein